jgi:hypothetical protein
MPKMEVPDQESLEHAARSLAIGEGAGMRIGLMSAVAIAALAVSVPAPAATITASSTGTITLGGDGGLGGADDLLGVFGGGNLLGDAATLFFSYDPNALIQVANQNGEAVWQDAANDGAITEMVTIGNASPSASNQGAASTAIVVDCAAATCGRPTLEFAIDSVNADGSQSLFLMDLFGLADLAPADIGNQTAINSFLGSGPANGVFLISAVTATGAQTTDVLALGTGDLALPEPSTWAMAAMGLGGLALTKWRRAAKRSRP